MPIVVFRVDGHDKIGMGHISRCMALANEFKQNTNFNPIFIVKNYEETVKNLRAGGYDVKTIPYHMNATEEYDYLCKLLDNCMPQILITDLPHITEEHLCNLKNICKLLVTIDDLNLIRFNSDIIVSGYLPAMHYIYNFYNSDVGLYVGPKYLMLKDVFKQLHQRNRQIKVIPDSILVTLGGADPKNLTVKVIEALNMLKPSYNITVVIGPAFNNTNNIINSTNKSHHNYIIKSNVNDMHELMWNSDIAITAGGETSYELACLGTPAINISHVEHQVVNANELEKAGTLINLGLSDRVTQDEIYDEMDDLLSNAAKRKQMSKNGWMLVDGQGSHRVMKLICNRFKNIMIKRKV